MAEHNEYNEHNRQPGSERTNHGEDTFVERRSDGPDGDRLYNERRSDPEETPLERVDDTQYRERRFDPNMTGERPYEERRNEAFSAVPPAGPWWRRWSARPTRRVGCLLPLLLLLVALLLGGLVWGSLGGPHSVFASPLHTMLCGSTASHGHGHGTAGHEGAVHKHPRPAPSAGVTPGAASGQQSTPPANGTAGQTPAPKPARTADKLALSSSVAPWCKL